MWGIKYKDCDYFLGYIIFKDDLIEYKCLCSNENYLKKFDKSLNKRIYNTYKFSFIQINTWMIQ